MGVPDYFFLVWLCLAATACCFFCATLLVLLCFCVDFFWFAFGDLSPMDVSFCSEFPGPPNRCFSADASPCLGAERM